MSAPARHTNATKTMPAGRRHKKSWKVVADDETTNTCMHRRRCHRRHYPCGMGPLPTDAVYGDSVVQALLCYGERARRANTHCRQVTQRSSTSRKEGLRQPDASLTYTETGVVQRPGGYVKNRTRPPKHADLPATRSGRRVWPFPGGQWWHRRSGFQGNAGPRRRCSRPLRQTARISVRASHTKARQKFAQGDHAQGVCAPHFANKHKNNAVRDHTSRTRQCMFLYVPTLQSEDAAGWGWEGPGQGDTPALHPAIYSLEPFLLAPACIQAPQCPMWDGCCWHTPSCRPIHTPRHRTARPSLTLFRRFDYLSGRLQGYVVLACAEW